jgi:hypothetical protein
MSSSRILAAYSEVIPSAASLDSDGLASASHIVQKARQRLYGGDTAPGWEPLVLPGLLVQVADPAHDQPRGDLLSFLRGERGVFRFGDLGVRDPAAGLVIPDRARVPDRYPGLLWDGGDRRGDLGSMFTVTENRAPTRRMAQQKAAE